MVGGPRADQRGDLSAAGFAQLVGVDARHQPCAPARIEDLLRFDRSEDAVLAEHVVPLGQIFGCDRGDHLVDEQAQVAVAVVLELRWQLMRTHEGRGQLDRLLGGEPGNCLQDLALALGRQAVATLHLRRCRAGAQHLGQAGPAASTSSSRLAARVA